MTTFTEEQITEINRASNDGERVVPIYRNDCYYAHLSIYRFAIEMAKGGRVLDAGCGTGYGSHYLLKNGAKSVLALDFGKDAIRFCRLNYREPRLSYRRMDIAKMKRLGREPYDPIFTSNALEHVPNVENFFRSAHGLLSPTGNMLVAVPPLIDEKTINADLENRYHLNNWSPEQWLHTMSKYLEEVKCYHHKFTRRDEFKLNFLNYPNDCKITEVDFEFTETTTDIMREVRTLTALFVVRKPRPAADIPPEGTATEFIDQSSSRPPPEGSAPTESANAPWWKRIFGIS